MPASSMDRRRSHTGQTNARPVRGSAEVIPGIGPIVALQYRREHYASIITCLRMKELVPPS